jgi:hypoxanthine phosphoribosyltransferase
MLNSKLSWEEVVHLARKLATDIKKSGFEPDYLIGVTRGGIFPLGFLAQELDVRNILTVSTSSYTGRKQGELRVIYMPEIELTGKRLLLIDEVIETGKTMETLVKRMSERYQPAELRTAVLVLNTVTSRFSPDFKALEAREWTIFPWESE